ncbi:MAG: (2Fe-2S) ferredoxin domain-containing protein [Bacteroidales bacterium]|jgi:NADH:ubiquinone oxidoreductase subunit E|nr:(2Fe-2S) ferredoxin domain-containing protein [Bacteroidales bacterium]MBR5777105.1 (2Fe-2S) ferredoxin domain-containing protein [Bacteroidales bacterium]
MEKQIVICMGSSCFARGNKNYVEVIKRYLQEHNLSNKIVFKGQLCSDNCSKGPVIQIGETEYYEIDEVKLKRILHENFAAEN